MSQEHGSKRVVVWVQHFGDRPFLVLQWHDPLTGDRKSKSSGTNNPLEAEKLRADLEYEINHGLHKDASRVSWERFRERFEEEYVSALRVKTQKTYRGALDLFEELCRPTSMKAITQRTVSTFAAEMRKKPTWGRVGMMASTMAIRLQILQTAFKWAVEQEFMVKVPAFPRIRVPEKTPQPVPAETFERLLAKSDDPHMTLYLLTGWLAGLRLEEASILEWEQTTTAPYVDLAANRIVLPAEYTKGSRDTWLPIDPVLREALENHPRQGKKVFRFTSRSTGGPLTVSGLSDRVRGLAVKAGVRLTMHALRRGFGCRYAGKVPAQVLQRLMRHRNISITMKYYANIDDAIVEAVCGSEKKDSRNSPRNTEGSESVSGERASDASAEQD